MDFSLYNIDPPEFRIIERFESEDGITYILSPSEKQEECPTCHSTDIIKWNSYTRKARDLSEHAKLVGLIINTHRYRCNNCHSTWVPSFRSVDSNAKMTNRMRKYIQKQSLSVPFSKISHELDVSVPTIKNVFAQYVDSLDKRRNLSAPIVLGMDENYLNGKYRCIFTDIENGLILDLLPDRRLISVREWISKLPEKERIECATMDMWGSYKDAVESELPNVPIVIDKFHVIKNLQEAFDSIRKGISDGLTSKERLHLKKSRFLMLKGAETLNLSEKLFLHDLLESFPDFKEPYSLKEDFRAIYGADTRTEAEALYLRWKDRASCIPGYLGFIDTVDNWSEEIFNYFDHPYTNAVTESLNGVCKEIAAVGRGYTFSVLRAKILYGTKATRPAKFHYYEKETPVKMADAASYAFTPLVHKKQKHVDVSEGVSIRLLAYLLGIKEFWKSKEEQIIDIDN